MIHQVKPHREDVEKLQYLVKLQLLVLGIAAQEQVLDKDKLIAGLQARYGERSNAVAEWLANKKKAILSNLNTFAASADIAIKGKFVAQLQADIDLLFTPQQASLNVAFSAISDADDWGRGRIAAGEFCKHFYELWGKTYEEQPPGFPHFLFPNSAINDTFDRWQFIDHFITVNSTLYLCSICDATAYRTQVDSQAYTSIEHFFPKSIYPHLAIHPYNLIPICTYCNSNKSDDDLMALCSSQGGISELILPYRENGFSHCAYVEVTERQASSSRQEHPLQIKVKPATAINRDHNLLARAFANFEAVYDVEKRWNHELEQISEQTFRRLQQFMMADVQMGNNLSSIEFVKERIGILMALTSQENLGRDPFAFAGMWMLKYFEDSLATHGEQAVIYRALKDWAESHRSKWRQLQQHAEEIRKRVPNSIQ